MNSYSESDAQKTALWLLISCVTLLSFQMNGDAQDNAPVEIPITATFLDAANSRTWKGSQAGLDCLDTASSKRLMHIDCGLSEIHAIRPTSDGKGLLVGGGQAGQVGQVVRISTNPPHEPMVVATAPDVIYSIDCCRDIEEQFATACWDGICRIFRFDSDKPMVEYQGHTGPVLAIVFLDGSSTVASAGVDNTIQIWNGKTGQRIRTLDNHTNIVHAIAIRPMPSPSDQLDKDKSKDLWIATASEDRTVRFWQPLRGRMVRFAKLASIPRSLQWSADGSRLKVALDDGKTVELDPQTAQAIDQTLNP